MAAIVRRAVPEDAARIAGVHIGTWQAAYRGQLPDAFLDGLSAGLERRSEWWRGEIATPRSPSHQVWVAEADATVAGFVAIGPANERDVGPSVGEVYAIYVEPRFWDRGVGRALFEKAVGELKAHGFKAAVLWVLGTNERARRFYEIAGWRTDGAAKTETRPGGVELNEVRYRIDLASTRSLA